MRFCLCTLREEKGIPAFVRSRTFLARNIFCGFFRSYFDPLVSHDITFGVMMSSVQPINTRLSMSRDASVLTAPNDLPWCWTPNTLYGGVEGTNRSLEVSPELSVLRAQALYGLVQLVVLGEEVLCG